MKGKIKIENIKRKAGKKKTEQKERRDNVWLSPSTAQMRFSFFE